MNNWNKERYTPEGSVCLLGVVYEEMLRNPPKIRKLSHRERFVNFLRYNRLTLAGKAFVDVLRNGEQDDDCD